MWEVTCHPVSWAVVAFRERGDPRGDSFCGPASPLRVGTRGPVLSATAPATAYHKAGGSAAKPHAPAPSDGASPVPLRHYISPWRMPPTGRANRTWLHSGERPSKSAPQANGPALPSRLRPYPFALTPSARENAGRGAFFFIPHCRLLFRGAQRHTDNPRHLGLSLSFFGGFLAASVAAPAEAAGPAAAPAPGDCADDDMPFAAPPPASPRMAWPLNSRT